MMAARGAVLLLLALSVASISAAPILGESADLPDAGANEVKQLAPEGDAATAAPAADAKDAKDAKADDAKAAPATDSKDAAKKESAAPAADSKDAKDAKADDAKATPATDSKDAAKESAAPAADAKESKADDAKAAPATDSKDAAKKESAAPAADAKDAKADDAKAAPAADSDIVSKVKKVMSDAGMSPEMVLARNKESLEREAVRAATAKTQNKELGQGFDEHTDDNDSQAKKDQETLKFQPAVAKQPIQKPPYTDDDSRPMAKMPTGYPFGKKEDDSEKAYKSPDGQEDPYKQRGTYTDELKAHDEHMAWEDHNPVKENGETRPWDDLNDFQDPKAKVERAKKIADDIFTMATRKVASVSEKNQMQQQIRDMKAGFKKSRTFLKRIIKASREADKKEKLENRKFDQRVQNEIKDPKLGIANRMLDEMKKEDNAAVENLKTVPAQWAIDEVTKEGNNPAIKVRL